jgi:hypothetical protein
MADASGPLTTRHKAAPPVLVSTALALKAGSSMADRAASTTGKEAGAQPAMTALTAACSAVTERLRAVMVPSISSAPTPPATSMASTRSGVGGTTGRPSVSPSAKNTS